MSIIQDALNKAQNNIPPEQNPGKNITPTPPPSQPPKNVIQKPKTTINSTLLLRIIGIIVLIILLIVAITNMLKFNQKTKKPVPVTLPASNYVESSLEIIKKPEEIVTPPATTNPDQPPQDAKAVEEKPKPEIPSLTLNGIFFSEKDESWAIVNGKIVKIGDSVSGAKITEITASEVKLNFYDIELSLKLK